MENYFEKLCCGQLISACGKKRIGELGWNKHPEFEGVELKHIVTAGDTAGEFSCHIVKIAPNMKIGSHIHREQTELHEVICGEGACIMNKREEAYTEGTVCIIDRGTEHEVRAGDKGLFLAAKFILALC
ncbi:MAG: cupin domain-containing protein [Ruminococcus sp.]|nr:cupin domain-containing protein [Ruminococcus sp.]